MNFAFFNPRLWLRNGIQAGEIERINYWLERLREKASSQYLSSNTALPGHLTVSPLSRTHTHSHE